MTERRKKIKQTKIILRIAAIPVLIGIVLTLLFLFSVIPSRFEALHIFARVLFWAGAVCFAFFRNRKNKLICCPYCGVFLREEFIDSPRFTCLGCGKDVDNSKV